MIYLDNAATSRFKPSKAAEAMARAYLQSANPGRSGHSDAIDLALQIEDARERLRDFFGLENIVFTKSCTEALNMAIFSCVDEGEVITSSLEHNSVYRPLTKLKQKKGVNIKIAQGDANGLISPSTIASFISSRTQAIVINEVSNVLGVSQPIEEIGQIAKQYNVPFIVDTAQSAGHTQTCYKDVDAICSSGHKGLHGPQGVGVLAFNDKITMRPLLYGGTGTSSLELDQPFDVPEGLEAGTLNGPGIVALGESLAWTSQNIYKIIAHIDRLAQDLAYGLSTISGVKLYNSSKICAGVILFNIYTLSSSSVADTLSREYNIATRGGLHCAPLAHALIGTSEIGGVRASIGYNNSKKDIEECLRAIEQIAKSTKGR